MRQDINLFIGGKEVEFSSDPKILFNFKLTELQNPTTVRNSWSKSITIPSTPTNDDIFNHFWNLERTNDYVDFNPMCKTNFELYINNTLIQNGYCKLDSVKTSSHKTEFQISLFGMLGDFFYNLSYFDGDESNSKKTLASLNYADGYDLSYGTDPDLNFTINKETVKEAWEAIIGNGYVTPDDKWSVINFAPCYNGIPNDFDANKVLLNYRGINRNIFYSNWNSGEDWSSSEYHYQPMINGSKNYSGYSVAEASEEMTCDETFDLRSYLQRPVVNVYRTIMACCNPANNGGYQVKLDPHFFKVDNPYYYGENAWVTLPMLRDLEIKGGETTQVTGATITSRNRNLKDINFNASSLSEISNVRIKINVGLSTSYTGNTLYTYNKTHYNRSGLFPAQRYVKDFEQNEGLVMQLIARDTNGVICGASDAHCLSSYQYNPYNGNNIWEQFWNESSVYPEPPSYQYHQGKWMKKNGSWVFCNMNGTQVDIEFSFPSTKPISSLELLVQTNYARIVRPTGGDRSIPDTTVLDMWKQMNVNGSGNYELNTIYSTYSVDADFTYNITEFYAEATDYEALFSNTYIPKEKLLSTSYSPAEFLISYCKMFGLYFFRDPAEEADDTTLCPNGVIHIMDRNTFFNGEYVNLEERIDHSKDMNISPSMAGSKWYSFDLDPVESAAEQAYDSTYGYHYGRALVNTNYNFDNNTTELYDGNVFKSGIMVREKDKYFAMPYKKQYQADTPVYVFNGFKYTLYDTSSADSENLVTVELEVTPKVLEKTNINDLGLKGYDVMPKLQCHNEDNGAVDGEGVLLFYKSPVHTTNDYWLTDDVLDMQTLNGNACWLMTNSELDALGNRIAYKTNYLPQFTRDFINFGFQEGNIVHSWNFGHPQVTFSPNTYSTEGDCIYDKCWKQYIADMYNQNGKKLTCYVNLEGIPSNAWLRRWYWFNNSVWRLNEISDWNAGDPSTTLCEFIKVQDINNYKLDEITQEGIEGLTLSQYTIGRNGGTINGVVYLQSGGQWFTADSSGVITGRNEGGTTYYEYNAVLPLTGSGVSSNITVTIPPSSSQTPITWHIMVEDDFDNVLSAYVVQDGVAGVPYLNINETGVVMPSAGGTSGITYNSGNMIESSITAGVGVARWVVATIDRTNKTVALSAETNTGSSIRRTTLTVSGYGLDNEVYSDTCQVAQPPYGGYTIVGSPVVFDYDQGTGTTKTFTISGDTTMTWQITAINDEQ